MKLAYIGTGKIVCDALRATAPLENIEKTAVFAREHSREKAEALAKQYGIHEIYTDYMELLKTTQADTVYIGLINNAHYPYAKEALLYGKNVILEKPLTGFLYQAEELQSIAREKHLCIMEAVTVLHNDVFYYMKDNIEKLGTIRMVLANYSQYSSRYDSYLEKKAEHCFSPEYYGGALYDINVYNIHYCVGLLGEPKVVKYYPNIGFNGIDTSGTLIMEYDGFTAACTGSKDSDSPGYVSVQGEKGYMSIKGKPNVASAVTMVCVDENIKEKVMDDAGATVRASVTKEYTAQKRCHRMTQEFTEFADVIDRKDLAAADKWMSESVTVVKILEQARLGAGISFSVE